MSSSFSAFFFFLLDFTAFEMAVFLIGEACGAACEFCLLFSLGVGVGVGIGVSVDVSIGVSVDVSVERSADGFIAFAIGGVTAADDGEECSSGNSGRRSLPPFRDGDLKTEAAEASC